MLCAQAASCLSLARLIQHVVRSDADGAIKLWDIGVRRATHTQRCAQHATSAVTAAMFASSVASSHRTHACALTACACARPARRAHSASAGVLGVGTVPGAHDALLTQGRDGTLKRWQARALLRQLGRRGLALTRAHLAPSQLLPDGALCDRPSASISTGSYNFCRFAALGTREPLRQRAGPAPCVGSTAAEDAAADEAALRSGDGVDVDAFLAATPPEAPGAEAGDADSDDEPGSEGGDASGAASASVSALVALAGTDPATIELWDLASGACFAASLPGGLADASRLAPPSAECAVRLGAPPPAEGAERAGMLMVLRLHAAPSGALYALGGYEDGWCACCATVAALLDPALKLAILRARSVRLWDVRAPAAPLLRLSLHKEPVMALALDSRGRRGASGAADAQARDSASVQRLHARC